MQNGQWRVTGQPEKLCRAIRCSTIQGTRFDCNRGGKSATVFAIIALSRAIRPLWVMVQRLVVLIMCQNVASTRDLALEILGYVGHPLIVQTWKHLAEVAS